MEKNEHLPGTFLTYRTRIVEKPGASDRLFLDRIRAIIEERLGDEHFTVEELAKEAGLSRSMLHRKLKKLSGMAAGDIITGIRLQRALELLESDAGTVSEIAYRVGFSDPGYFTRVFKRYFNILPNEVKKSSKEKKFRRPLAPIPAEGEGSVRRSVPRRRAVIVALLSVFALVIVSFHLFNRIRPAEASLAVLPFKNFTGNPENSYLVDGMHDLLIGELSRSIESLRVISRTTTERYRDTSEPMKQIARDLGVKTLVEGSVAQEADSLVFIIQVIDVFPKESHVFYGEYREEMSNVLRMHRKAVNDFARKTGAKLSKGTKEPRQVDPETFKLYLQGIHYLNHGTVESFLEGIRYMRLAIDSDPGDPLPYAGLALGYALHGHGLVLAEGSFQKAAEAAQIALRIDPTLDEAYTALALIHSYQVWDWPKVKSDYEQALANNPNNAVAHAHFSFYYTLFNEPKKALSHAMESIALEPFSAFNHAALAYAFYLSRKFREAEEYALKALALEPTTPYALLVLGWCLLEEGMEEEALELQDRLPEYADYYKMLTSYTLIRTGQEQVARQYLAEMEEKAGTEFVNPVFRGMLAGMLGDYDRAFELFNEAADKKIFPVTYIKVYPGIDGLKADPRYRQVMDKLGLPV